MKKLVSMMLCLTLLCSLAFAESAQTITFRGIEWGCTLQEAIDALAGDGSLFHGDLNEESSFTDDDLEGFSGLWSYSDGMYFTDLEFNEMTDYGHVAFVTFFDGLNVAGYNANIMVFGLNASDGKTYSEVPEESTFIRADYTISMAGKSEDEINVVMDDLKTKLTTLYGESTEKNQIYGPVWRGADNTALSLYTVGDDYIFISYWDTTAGDKLEALKQAMVNSAKSDASEVSGL